MNKPRRRFRSPHRIPSQRPARLLSLSRLPIPQHSLAQRRSFFCRLSRAGRKGALQYDIASLLYDAKADLPPDLRQLLLDHYLDRLAGFIPLDREAFLRHYYAYVYIRIMQRWGAYGFRGFYERRAHFWQSVPYALKNLRWLLHHVRLPVPLPALMDAFKGMLGLGEIAGPCFRSGQSRRAHFQFFHSSPRLAEGREWQCGRLRFRRPQPPESRTRRALQDAHRQGHTSDRLPQSAGERASISRRRSCRWWDSSISNYQQPRLQEFDGFVRLHSAASIALSSSRSNWPSACAPGTAWRWPSAYLELENSAAESAPVRLAWRSSANENA